MSFPSDLVTENAHICGSSILNTQNSVRSRRCWSSETSNWANLVADWLGDFLLTKFLRIYKRREFQTLHAKSMWWKINANVGYFNIFPLFFDFFTKNTQNSMLHIPTETHPFFNHQQTPEGRVTSIFTFAVRRLILSSKYNYEGKPFEIRGVIFYRLPFLMPICSVKAVKTITYHSISASATSIISTLDVNPRCREAVAGAHVVRLGRQCFTSIIACLWAYSV